MEKARHLHKGTVCFTLFILTAFLVLLFLTQCGGGSVASNPTAPPLQCDDDDGDGYGSPASEDCTYPEADCNDNDDTVYPGAPQLCDGKNNDCDDPNWPAVPADEADGDGDNVRICAGDCDDGDANNYPGNAEDCGDGQDNDCDGDVDCDDTDCQVDADFDTYPVAPCGDDCDDNDGSVYPGAPQLCDGKNNDCDDPNWPAVPSNETDDDGDTVSECEGDCDDNDIGNYPGNAEDCGDGRDNDCDGDADCDDTDCRTDADSDTFMAEPCGDDCDDNNDTVYPGAVQLCDGVNNDCGDPGWPAVPADEADADGDTVMVCEDDCDDNDGSVYPGAAQLCDGVNNDCNDPNWPAVPSNETDDDGDTVSECEGDCDDNDGDRYPGNIEDCADGKDNDCDGEKDCTDSDCAPIFDPDGDGVSSDGDCSGTMGDNWCFGGETEDCDDNCPDTSNADQESCDHMDQGEFLGGLACREEPCPPPGP